MSKENGGAAFGEFQQVGQCSVKTGGMSLRDYFAAKAMQAIVSAVPHLAAIDPRDAAEESFAYADAMLAAREVSK